MKKFLSMFAIALTVTTFWACSDDDDSTPGAPAVTAPASVTDVLVEAQTPVTFNVEVPGGYSDASVTASGGTAVVTTEPAVGAKTGNVVVTFTAGSNLGAGSIILTVTDRNDKTGIATAVLNIAEEVVPTVDVNFNISEDETWETGTIYILRGRITVESGATLTIEPGVIVKGDLGTQSNAKALMVARGGKLMAEGTAEQPIIFTSIDDEIKPGEIESPNLEPNESGKWGGLIILGKAPISVAGNLTEVQIEGIPTSDLNGLYGGNDELDNSGVITYVSIRHGGANIGSGNEINGLTLGGVGSGTVIDHVEVVANQDDGIEFFGGTVSVSNVVIWNSFDDGLDTDQAWNGTVDNFVIVSPNTGSAFELDGPEGSYFDGNATMMNGTVYAGPDIADLIDFDANSQIDMSDIYFFGITNGTSVKEYAAMAAGGGSVANFEHTLGALDPAVVFLGIPTEELAAVTVNANTVGADVSVFGWTWASQSGAFAGIGLE
jgi:hypothetical protein